MDSQRTGQTNSEDEVFIILDIKVYDRNPNNNIFTVVLFYNQMKLGRKQLQKSKINIRGYKGQNSTETPCRGFLVLESRCHGCSVLESRCHSFLSSEKMPWNHDVVDQLSPFLDVVLFQSPNLDVMFFWSWNLDVVVYVSPWPRFHFH